MAGKRDCHRRPSRLRNDKLWHTRVILSGYYHLHQTANQTSEESIEPSLRNSLQPLRAVIASKSVELTIQVAGKMRLPRAA